jgi:hypothetical protein
MILLFRLTGPRFITVSHSAAWYSLTTVDVHHRTHMHGSQSVKFGCKRVQVLQRNSRPAERNSNKCCCPLVKAEAAAGEAGSLILPAVAAAPRVSFPHTKRVSR